MIRPTHWGRRMGWRKLRLRSKLLLSYLLLLSLALGLLAVLNYERFSSILTRHTLYTTQKNFEQSYAFLSEKLDKIKHASDLALNNADIQALFAGRPELRLGEVDKLLLAGKAVRSMEALAGDSDIVRMVVYLERDNPYSGIGYDFGTVEQGKNELWYDKLLASADKTLWAAPAYMRSEGSADSPPEAAESLSLFRIVRDSTRLQRSVGVLRVDFHADMIANILNNAIAVRGGVVSISNGEGVPVAVTDWAQFYRYAALSGGGDAGSAAGGDNIVSHNGETYFYFQQRFADTDWTLATWIPYRSVFAETIRLRNEIILLIGIISAGAFALATFLSHTMTRRISALTQHIQKVKVGQFRVNADPEDKDEDEIGKLTKDFHAMVTEISKLVEERYQAGIRLKNAELRTLQAQINPHFLYNTLDMINWLSRSKRTADVERMIRSLAAFYKIGLSQGKDEISIRQELEHVRHYMQIQNMRFEDRIDYVEEVPDRIKGCFILRMTLQPLVENAILHGILKKNSREGTIFITGEIGKGTITLSIEDDGEGFPPSVADSPIAQWQGYGIKNVNERIKLAYGEQYGLEYGRARGAGTIVKLCIPAKAALS